MNQNHSRHCHDIVTYTVGLKYGVEADLVRIATSGTTYPDTTTVS
jgi:hypothetical protein